MAACPDQASSWRPTSAAAKATPVTVDADGNAYAAMHKGGRAEVVDEVGDPLGTILVEGGKEKFLNTLHEAIRPGTTEVYLLGSGPGGVKLFEFQALGEGM